MLVKYTCLLVVCRYTFATNTVTTVAGQLGTPGDSDGPALAGAAFTAPMGLAFGADGSLYIADRWGHQQGGPMLGISIKLCIVRSFADMVQSYHVDELYAG